jgi:Low molecular weight phosphotyrosine protein phosphatase
MPATSASAADDGRTSSLSLHYQVLRHLNISASQGVPMSDKPSVLFVCVHNAGRSEMAAGYLNHLAGGRIEVRSAGSEPADKINPVAVRAMAEEGIDIAAEHPKSCPMRPFGGSSDLSMVRASSVGSASVGGEHDS